MFEVFTTYDVKRILVALASAGVSRGSEYHQALCDVALAFGIELPPSTRWRVVDANSTETDRLE